MHKKLVYVVVNWVNYTLQDYFRSRILKIKKSRHISFCSKTADDLDSALSIEEVE